MAHRPIGAADLGHPGGRQGDPPTAPEPPPTTNRRSRLPLSTLVLIEVILALALVAATIWGAPIGWPALAVALVATVALLRFGSGPSPANRLGQRLGFAWARSRRGSRDLAPAPFDIPVSGSENRGAALAGAGATMIGARWAGDTLVTVLRVSPGTPALTYLTPSGGTVTDPSGQVIPLDVLASSINPFDIELSSIEVVSHGIRTWGTGAAAQTYHRTLGPLAATAHRSVYVVLRLRPLDCADAVARRGGGATGALRTATITTRRVARRLAEHGLAATPVSAAEMTALTAQLIDGAGTDDLDESWDQVTAGPLRMRSAAIEPHALAEVLRTVWVNTALSTTVTVRLRHDPDGRLEVGGLVRYGELPDAGRTVGTLPPGLTLLDGRQFDAVAASLPISAPTRLDRRLPVAVGDEATALVEQITLPAGGCGQLIGADHAGRAVSAPLIGAGVDSVAVAADIELVGQLTLRAVAIGAAVTVHTHRPDHWRHLVSAIGDLRSLALATDRADQRGGYRVLVFDGLSGPPPEPSTTHITVLPAGDPRVTEVVDDAAIIIRQNPRSPQDISIVTAGERAQVTMVATPDEWGFIGGPPEPGPVPSGRTLTPSTY
ncbi:type VII secretion protein EccE [Gordonia soli]|uniref:Type VII secretion system protein EccE domain-containing protein n=1 Tax=Gordonia soli NBRC 108243 TaxID=1223545 RepID=M0QDB1_9ACTN|nr:type VII secretion protein EccE [Gordonia soli]GAC66409.1 hypothetical protein GS4_02_01200 [Gordonia soli NBRC 108243]